MAWAKLESNTLTGTADDISNTITETTFLQSMLHKINTGGEVNPNLTFNSDSGSNYAQRNCTNGGSESTLGSQTKLEFTNSVITPTSFVVMYSINITGEEKLNILFEVEEKSSGAGTAPDRIEHVSKWANTSAQITTVNFGNDAAGDYAIGSNATVLGTD